MFKRPLFIVYYFLWVLCAFNASATLAMEPEFEVPYSTINRLWEHSKLTLGAFIEAYPDFKNPILKNCLATTIGKPQGGVISAVKPDQITQFFEEQELRNSIGAPDRLANEKIKTFNGAYGVEFPEHGPVEDKTIALIKSLAQQGKVTFLDIGAGYGGRIWGLCQEGIRRL